MLQALLDELPSYISTFYSAVYLMLVTLTPTDDRQEVVPVWPTDEFNLSIYRQC